MTDERCGICEAGNRDLGILIGSVSVIPSQITDDKVAAAYARLSPWVSHLRDMPNARAHVDALDLPNLSRTAYVQNILRAVGNPKLQDASMLTLNRAQQDEVFASALVLLVSDQRVSPL